MFNVSENTSLNLDFYKWYSANPRYAEAQMQLARELAEIPNIAKRQNQKPQKTAKAIRANTILAIAIDVMNDAEPVPLRCVDILNRIRALGHIVTQGGVFLALKKGVTDGYINKNGKTYELT